MNVRLASVGKTWHTNGDWWTAATASCLDPNPEVKFMEPDPRTVKGRGALDLCFSVLLSLFPDLPHCSHDGVRRTTKATKVRGGWR